MCFARRLGGRQLESKLWPLTQTISWSWTSPSRCGDMRKLTWVITAVFCRRLFSISRWDTIFCDTPKVYCQWLSGSAAKKGPWRCQLVARKWHLLGSTIKEFWARSRWHVWVEQWVRRRKNEIFPVVNAKGCSEIWGIFSLQWEEKVTLEQHCLQLCDLKECRINGWCSCSPSADPSPKHKFNAQRR